MLEIKNLHARIDDKEIIKGLSLDIQPGTVHTIMGPNGAGKSSLSNVLAGHAAYEVTEGSVTLNAALCHSREGACEKMVNSGTFCHPDFSQDPRNHRKLLDPAQAQDDRTERNASLFHTLEGGDDSKAQDESGRVNLLDMDIGERALSGIFMSFQQPIEIPGVSCMNFLKMIFNAHRKHRGEAEVDSAEFLKRIKTLAARLGISFDMLKRSVNEGFSGGEKKRFEMLQMLLLEPKLVILDETDSGLDIDAIKAVSQVVNDMRAKDRSFLLITHYQRFLEFVKPDFVHVLNDGKIVQSGGYEIVEKIEQSGYQQMAAGA